MFGLISLVLNGDFLQAIGYIFSSAVVIFLLLPVHEAAHAFTAHKLGDNTAKYMGRLTLNPMRHIDWLGAAMIMLVGFGWAKPVPVDSRNFRNPKSGMAVTALAGPVSNLIMGFLALIILNALELVPYRNLSGAAAVVFLLLCYLFQFIASISIGLAVFNLIPVPPLDGSRLLTALLPDRIYYKIMAYERYIMLLLMLLLVTGALSRPLNYLTAYLFNALDFLAGLPFGG